MESLVFRLSRSGPRLAAQQAHDLKKRHKVIVARSTTLYFTLERHVYSEIWSSAASGVPRPLLRFRGDLQELMTAADMRGLVG